MKKKSNWKNIKSNLYKPDKFLINLKQIDTNPILYITYIDINVSNIIWEISS